MKQQMSVEIHRPIEEVFDYTNNQVAQWSLTVVENEVLEERPGQVGSTFRCVTEDHGCRMEFQGTVTAYDRPRFSSVHLEGGPFDLDVDYRFEDLGGRTRVTQESKVTPKGFFTRSLFLLVGWTTRRSSCRAQQRELNNLKRLLEEGGSSA